MRWPFRHGPPPDEPPPAFDALIDLHRRGTTPAASLESAVRDAVHAMPGSVWISVQVQPRAAVNTVRVLPAGSSVVPTTPAWTQLHADVSQVVERTIATVPTPAGPSWSPPPTSPRSTRGMAEAMSPSQLDALSQLASLAQLTRHPIPAAPKPPANTATPDIDRLAKLLAFVLPADAQPTAVAAIQHLGSFAAVLAAPETELRRIQGLGTHSIAAIKLVHAAAIRLARAQVAAAPVLDNPGRLAAYLATALARERIEQFRILFLDDAGMLRADEVQATGTVNHTPVYPREVVRRALELGAASLVLVHNHPSGNPEPSREDIEMTRQVQAAARTMQITVRDHMIVGNGSWLSFREAGLLS